MAYEARNGYSNDFERRRPSPSYENPRSDAGPPRNGRHSDFLEQRRQQRLQSSITIWPPSPEPSRSVSPDSEQNRKHRKKHKKDSKKHKSRHRYSDDESEPEPKSKRKHKEKSSKKESSSKRRKYSSTPEPASSRPAPNEAELWVEKSADLGPSASTALVKAQSPPKRSAADDSSDDDIGPKPMPSVSSKAADPRDYGLALRPGEGSAMAAYVADGKRIPRRGEIGLESAQIEAFEKVGYVMSGSRHRKMNAVRMRKENQVITAEEKRSLLKLQQEEKLKREQAIVSSFRDLITDKLQGSSADTSQR